MGIQGERLPANPEAPSQPRSQETIQPPSPSLATLRTQAPPPGPLSSRVPRSPLWTLGPEGAVGSPWPWLSPLPPGGRHSLLQRIRALGHPDFQFSPGVQLPWCPQPRHRAAQLPVCPCSELACAGSPPGWRLERACTSLPGQTGPWVDASTAPACRSGPLGESCPCTLAEGTPCPECPSLPCRRPGPSWSLRPNSVSLACYLNPWKHPLLPHQHPDPREP